MRLALVPSIVAPIVTETSSSPKPCIPTKKNSFSHLLSPNWLAPFSAEVLVARIFLQWSGKDCFPEQAGLKLSAFLQMLQEIINVKSSLLPSWTLSSDENSFSGKRETLYMVLLEERKTGLHWLSSAGIWQTSFLFDRSLWCLHCPPFQFKLQRSFILRTGWFSHGFPFQLWTTCMNTISMTQLMACKTKTVALTSWRCCLACSGSLTSQSLVCSTQVVAAIKPHISTLHSTECWRALTFSKPRVELSIPALFSCKSSPAMIIPLPSSTSPQHLWCIHGCFTSTVSIPTNFSIPAP